MRILVLSKRRYTGKDLIDDRYGRIFHLSAELARLGHEVTGVALNYRSASQGEFQWKDTPGLVWHSVNVGLLPLRRYLWSLHKLIRESRPDLIWVCSDAFHAILGGEIKRRYSIPTVIDLYDNFESFSATRIWGVLPAFRRACRMVSGLTIVGKGLEGYVKDKYGVESPLLVLHNGTDPAQFYPRDRIESRRALGLPEAGRLIGTAGAISAGRGIKAMFDAFLKLESTNPDLYLVFAGPRDKTPSLYYHPRIIDMGVLAQDKVPLLLSALDLGIISNKDSAFGRYCFPQKLYEMIGCNTSFVAADIGEVSMLLKHQRHVLFPPDNADQLANLILHMLGKPLSLRTEIQLRTWKELAEELEVFFSSISTGIRRQEVNHQTSLQITN